MSTTITSTAYRGILPISAIEPSPTNPRKNFDPTKITLLADTIKAQGRILQKLLVRPWPGREGVFECVDGARRRLAAIQLGWDELPVEVLEMTDAQVIEIQLITGETGEPLSPLEEAEGFQTALGLKDASGAPCFTLRSLADKIGCSTNHVKQRVDLLRLPVDAREMMTAGRLAPRTANMLARVVGKEALAAAIKEIVYPKHRDEPLTYREAEAIIHDKYMCSLRAAPFDLQDVTLGGPELDPKTKEPVPQACTSCPLKSGNAPEVFGDVKDKNVCTNPGCYRAKCNTAWERTTARAKAAGQRVLSDDETLEVFEKNSPVVQIAFSSPYVDVSSKPTYRHVANEVEDAQLPTWRELLDTAAEKKGIKVPTVLARDRTGKQWELVQLTLAIEAARAVGEDMFKKIPVGEAMTASARFERDAVRSTVRGTDDFAAKKKAEAEATKRRTVESSLGLVALHSALAKKMTGNEVITDALFPVALHHAGNDGLALVVKAFDLKSGGGEFALSDAVEAWYLKLPKAERHAVIPVLLIAQSMRWSGLKCEGFDELARVVKLDCVAIVKVAEAQLTGAKAAKVKPVTMDKKILEQWVKARAKGMPVAEIARSYKVTEEDVRGALGESGAKGGAK